MQKRKQKYEAMFLIRSQTHKKQFSGGRQGHHKFHPLTRMVRGVLWVVIFSLMIGSVFLTIPETRSQVLGISLLNENAKPNVRLAAETGVVVADLGASAQPTPAFTIVSPTTSSNPCSDDSMYTPSTLVTLSFQNVSNLADFQIETTPAAFVNDQNWTSLNDSTVTSCNGARVVKNFDLRNFVGASVFQSAADSRKQILVYVRFRDSSGNIIPAATPHYLTDGIFFGYPWIQTQRGDVHSNVGIDGEISDVLNQVNYSQILCNPPAPAANADYIVSLGNNGTIRQVSGGPTTCDEAMGSLPDGKAETFGTNGVSKTGNAMVVQMPDNVPISGQVGYEQLKLIANVACGSNAKFLDFSVVDANGFFDPLQINGCHPGASSDFSKGLIIAFDHDNGLDTLKIGTSDPSNTVTLPNSLDPDKGASITILANSRDITLSSNFVYGSNGTIQNLNQLARFAVFSLDCDACNITLSKDIGVLSGIFYAEKSKIFTSQDPAAKKLSLYGSLIAYDIEFNRTWLGQ